MRPNDSPIVKVESMKFLENDDSKFEEEKVEVSFLADKTEVAETQRASEQNNFLLIHQNASPK